MTDTVPAPGQPIRIDWPCGPWDAIGRELSRHGRCLLYSVLADWPADPVPESRRRELLGREWTRYQAMPHPLLQRRFLASRALLKRAAGAVLGCPPESLDLAHTVHGRPHLRGCDQLDLSLSHTEDVLMLGLTTVGLIGVDIERTTRPLVSGHPTPRFCTPHDMELLRSLPEDARGAALIRLWTLKEAYTKAIGQGMRFRFHQIGFGLDSHPLRLLRPDGSRSSGDEWQFVTYKVSDRHCAGVALYDAGFGGQPDPASATMLDSELQRLLTAGFIRRVGS